MLNLATTLIGFVAMVFLLAVPVCAQADATAAQSIAGAGGRIIGAAKACGIDPVELVTATKHVFAAATQRAISDFDRGTLHIIFSDGYNVGIDDITSGRSNCEDARGDLTKIENEVRGDN